MRMCFYPKYAMLYQLKKYLFLIFEFITNSQFFVAFCALLFCAQTYLITGLNPDATVLTVVFFAALFIYNSAQLQLSWNFKSDDRHICVINQVFTNTSIKEM